MRGPRAVIICAKEAHPFLAHIESPSVWCVSKGAIQRIHFEAAKKMPLAHRLTHLWADDEVCCISRRLGWRKLLCSPPVLVRDKTCSPSGRCRPRTLATGTEQLFTLLSAANPASERAMRVFLFALLLSLLCVYLHLIHARRSTREKQAAE
jgi:hypothetical protein